MLAAELPKAVVVNDLSTSIDKLGTDGSFAPKTNAELRSQQPMSNFASNRRHEEVALDFSTQFAALIKSEAIAGSHSAFPVSLQLHRSGGEECGIWVG